jgi:hypothetical protein
MNKDTDVRPFAYLLIVAGCVLAFISAVVPHYNAGYRLMVGVLAAGLLPWLVYGFLTEILRGWALALPGVLLLGVHLWLTVEKRILDYDAYADHLIYAVPVLLAILGLPVGVLLGRWLDGSGAPRPG